MRFCFPVCFLLEAALLQQDWPQTVACRETILQRRREEYRDMVPRLFDMTGHPYLCLFLFLSSALSPQLATSWPEGIARRETILQRRREEYRDMVLQLFDMTALGLG